MSLELLKKIRRKGLKGSFVALQNKSLSSARNLFLPIIIKKG